MLPKILVLIAISVAVSLTSQAAHVESNPEDDRDLVELEVLAFGTSNVRTGMAYISQIAEATGKYRVKHTIWFLNSMEPSSGFEGLWNVIQENEKHPENNDKSVKQSGRSVRDYLQSKKWDVIILSSHRLTNTFRKLSGIVTTVTEETISAEREALSKCLEYIKTHALQARLFYWNVYQNGPSYDETESLSVRRYLESLEKRQEESEKKPFDFFMQDVEAEIRRCQDVCKQFSLDMIPVRQALWLAHVDPKWGYIFTGTNREEPPEPPNQPAYYFRPALVAGPVWNTGEHGKPSLGYDGHVNMYGSYMVGCLVLQALTGKDAIGNSFVPSERAVTWNARWEVVKLDTFQTLSADECTILQEVAAKTMKMKNDPPKKFIREYIHMREAKLKNKEKGIYKASLPQMLGLVYASLPPIRD
jgi:hypothetical protein